MTTSPGTRTLSPAKQALLAQRLRARAGAEVRPDIARRPDDEPPVASFAQERMWFLEQFAPGTAAYHLSVGVRLRGSLDVAALGAAVQTVAARHDCLRMCFPATEDGRPAVRVADEVTVPWRVVDVDGETQAQAVLAAEARVPFDLTAAPLWRATLVRLAEQDHVLQLLTHHIISDGWSTGLLLDEVAARYEATLTGRPAPPTPTVRYTDYAAWQRDRLAGPAAATDLAYWRATLADVPALELPTDRPRPAQQRSHGAGHPLRLPAELTAGLRRLAREHDATLFMVLLAGVQAVLSRHSGSDDFAIGTPVAGRVVADLENVIGLFTNTVAVRADVRGDPSFATLLERTRDRAIDALAHQEVPFERLVQDLGVARDVSRSPIFQVMFALHNYDPTMGGWPGPLVAEWYGVRNDTARFDLSLYTQEHLDGVSGWFVFNTDLFDPSTIARLAGHLVALLSAAVADPHRRVGDLELIDADQRRQLLTFGTDAGLDPVPPAPGPAAAGTLADLVAPHVAATPDAPAVVCGDRSMTYRELDRRANRIAHLLRSRGAGPESRVAICLDQSIDLAAAVLGVLKAGGAYVPLDPEQPPVRLAHMLRNAAPTVVLTSTALAPAVRSSAVSGTTTPATAPVATVLPGEAAATVLPGDAGEYPVICLDAVTADLAAQPDTAPPGPGPAPGNLAYVIYTSGSTGRPKGVAVAHQQVLRYLDGVSARWDIVPGARYALLQSLSFDFSVTVFYLALATGGSVHLVPRRGTGPELAAYLARHRIDYLKMTPSHLAALAADVPPGALLPARALILGGEASGLRWATELARQAAERGVVVVNHYGPTEATVGVTTFAVPPTPGVASDTGDTAASDAGDAAAGDAAGDTAAGGDATTPIGRPLRHARVYVLDPRGRPAPIGVPGEIHLGGDRLARGYLGQPALTAQHFRPDPYGPPGSRMYATGDRGRWTADGQLHFLGRVDQQVKVRGYRVEPGEVEAALRDCPGVAQAVVVLRGDRLIGYLQTKPGEDATGAAELRRLLLEQLPDYLVPTRFVWLDRLPLQEHGKVDRRALPEPPQEVRTATAAPPQGPVETAIAEVWASVLGVAQVGADDDFFDLGGHSLLATQVVARLRRALPEAPRPVSVMDMFRYRTVRELARLSGEVGAAPDGLLHELSRPIPIGRRVASLVCVPYGGASAVVYQPLADALPPGHALYAVAVPGHDIGLAQERVSIAEVADRCVAEVLATVDGPLIVYGHCGPGGALAVAIARGLEAAGRRLEAVYVGGIFPFARPSGGLLGPLLRLRLAERIRGDRVYANWLRGMGADIGALDDDQVTFLVRAMRQDALDAEEYFTDLLHHGVDPLRAPIVSVVGDRDPGVEYYEERYREWHFLAATTGLVIIDEGGHYFLKFRATELAEIVTTVHERLDGPAARPAGPAADPEAAPVKDSAAGPTEDPADSWRLAAVSRSADPAGTTPADGPQPSMRRFLTIAVGQLVSMTGTALTEFAIPLYIYLSTGSLVRFALFAVLGLVPGMLVAPFAGAIVDRSDRRTVMLRADAAAGGLALSLGLLLWTGHLQTWHLYGFVAALSVALGFQRIAYTSAVPQLVPKQYLGHANGVLQTAIGTAQFLVPLLAVGLMSTIGLGGILLLDVVSYAFAVTVLLCLKFPRTMARRQREGLLAEIAGGVRYSVGQRGFRAMLIFFAVLNIFLAPLFMLISPLVLSFATLESVSRVAMAGGAGAVLGGVVMAAWGGPRRRRMRGVFLTTLVVAAGSVVTGVRPSLVVIAAGAFCMSLALSMLNGVYATIIQTKVPQRFHGRVIALNTVAAWSTLPVGWAVMAPLATSVAEPLMRPGGPLAGSVGVLLGTGPGRGIGLVYLLFAVCMLVVVGVSWRTRTLARFDDDVPDAPPDDVVGLESRRNRLAARAGGGPSERGRNNG